VARSERITLQLRLATNCIADQPSATTSMIDATPLPFDLPSVVARKDGDRVRTFRKIWQRSNPRQKLKVGGLSFPSKKGATAPVHRIEVGQFVPATGRLQSGQNSLLCPADSAPTLTSFPPAPTQNPSVVA
jgi:hypothetical protein